MERSSHRTKTGGPLLCFIVAVGLSGAPDGALAAPPLYFCPDKTPDQQYSARQDPGCTPLVEKREKKETDAKKKDKPRRTLKIEDIQTETTTFLRKYREFLACCRTDPDRLEELDELGEEIADVLHLAQTGLFSEQMKLRGFTLSEMIPAVARARQQLAVLKKQQEQVGKKLDQMDDLDYETAGRTKRDIQQTEKDIDKALKPVLPPPAPRTGTEIGTIVGTGETSLPNRVGTKSNDTTLSNTAGKTSGSDQSTSLRPRTGPDASVDSDSSGTTLSPRIGVTPGSTTLRNETGFEIGTQEGPTGSSSLPSKAGPSVGDSSLNSR